MDKLAVEKLTADGLGAPLVLVVRSVTEKLTNEGTPIVTVSCAATPALAVAPTMAPKSTRIAARRLRRASRLTGRARA
jgi:hypothetical protein